MGIIGGGGVKLAVMDEVDTTRMAETLSIFSDPDW
jgi:hypothetical protein